jgi:hypothetical protein
MGLKKNVWAGKGAEEAATEKVVAAVAPAAPAFYDQGSERGFFHRSDQKPENAFLMRETLAHIRKRFKVGQEHAVLIEQIELLMKPYDLEPCSFLLPESGTAARSALNFLIRRIGWLRDFVPGQQATTYRIFVMLREVERAFKGEN